MPTAAATHSSGASAAGLLAARAAPLWASPPDLSCQTLRARKLAVTAPQPLARAALDRLCTHWDVDMMPWEYPAAPLASSSSFADSVATGRRRRGGSGRFPPLRRRPRSPLRRLSKARMCFGLYSMPLRRVYISCLLFWKRERRRSRWWWYGGWMSTRSEYQWCQARA